MLHYQVRLYPMCAMVYWKSPGRGDALKFKEAMQLHRETGEMDGLEGTHAVRLLHGELVSTEFTNQWWYSLTGFELRLRAVVGVRFFLVLAMIALEGYRNFRNRIFGRTFFRQDVRLNYEWPKTSGRE